MVKPYYILLSVILVSIFVASLLLMNVDKPQNQNTNSSITVVTTIFPLTDIVRQIAGPNIEVIQLVPSGSSPHSFSLSPKQISSLSTADVLFAVGHGLDDSVVNSALKIKNIPTILTDSNIQLNKFNNPNNNSEPQALSIDPHYWLNVPNAQIIATTIASSLKKIDPKKSDIYDMNLAEYQEQLEQLELELQQMAMTSKEKSFITIHDAWSYFTQQYNFNLVAVYEPIEGKQPSIKDIQKLGQIIKANKISTFFTEPQKQSDASARLMRQEFGLNIKTLDPIGGTPETDSYIKLMQRIMQSITETDQLDT